VAEPVPPLRAAEFSPSAFVAPIRHEEGAYPDLFGPDSYAVWVGPEVSKLKRDDAVEQGNSVDLLLDSAAQKAVNEYIVIECHVESVFGDMSVAYDVVGFRGIDLYLITPDGRKIVPVQRIMGSPVEEEQRLALKLFRRTNIAIFDKRDLPESRGGIDGPLSSIRLVVEGCNSKFFFEWGSAESAKAPPVSGQDLARVLKTSFQDLFNTIQRVSHIFD
jgi:hypothetical protein